MPPVIWIISGIIAAVAAFDTPQATSVNGTPINPNVPNDGGTGTTINYDGGGPTDRNGYYIANAPGGRYYGDALRATPVGDRVGTWITNFFGLPLPPTDPDRGPIDGPMISVDDAALKSWNADLVASLLAGNEAAGGGRGV